MQKKPNGLYILIKNNIVSIKEDASIWLNQSYFNYATGVKMVNESKWEQLFGFPAVKPDGDVDQKHCNMAYAIQRVTEEIVIKMAREAKRITGSKNLCMSGGVALNCVANGKLLKENIFKEIYIQPASGDAGGALGGALIGYHTYFDQERKYPTGIDSMNGSYLDPEYSDKEAVIALKNTKPNLNILSLSMSCAKK